MRSLNPWILVVTLAVWPVAVEAGVVSVRAAGLLDQAGAPLVGDGLAGAGTDDEIQCLWAGPNGIIDPPGEHGGAGGDDRLLHRAESPTLTHGATGEGVPFAPGTGGFVEDFEHALPAGAMVYVRAWNGPPPGSGCADHYGESATVALDNAEFARIDFGTWDAGTADTDGYVNRLSWSAGAQVFSWCPEAGSDHYNAYRGSRSLLPSDYGACMNASDPDLTDTAFADASSPAVSQVYTYLVTRTAASVEGSLGRDSFGVERLNVHPCP